MACAQSSISGKVAIITGASSGIGRGIALDFARQGCRLTLTGRDEANLELTKSQCMEKGLAADSILLVQADMMNNNDVERIFKSTVEKYNKIDILINNAGFLLFSNIDTFSMEDYHRLMQVNVHSVVYLTKLCVPCLEKTKGCIVNVSSIAGLKPFPNYWAYAMTKASLDQFCRSLALDLAPRGVRVNNVNPGAVVTNIYRGVDVAGRPDRFDRIRRTHALARVGAVGEVARVVSFLVSDRAGHTTGATALIDGGKTSMFCSYDDLADYTVQGISQ